MAEYRLEEIFEEIERRESAEWDRPSRHFFSLRHRRAMRKILHPDMGSKPLPNRIGRSLIPLRKRLFLLAVLLFLAAVTGSVVIFRIAGFWGTVYPDNIHLFAANDASAPNAIEELYGFAELPVSYAYTEGYGELGDPFLYRAYTDPESHDRITFHQYVKNEFNSHFDHEHSEFIEIEINAYDGFLWRSKDPGHTLKAVVWDNGDYIFCIDGNLDENAMTDLAKSVKVL